MLAAILEMSSITIFALPNLSSRCKGRVLLMTMSLMMTFLVTLRLLWAVLVRFAIFTDGDIRSVHGFVPRLQPPSSNKTQYQQLLGSSQVLLMVDRPRRLNVLCFHLVQCQVLSIACLTGAVFYVIFNSVVHFNLFVKCVVGS